MKKSLIALVVAMVLCLSCVGGSACTAIYVGSNLTEDGSTMFARSEDISNSMNKIFYVAPAGYHTAGEEYEGCYYLDDGSGFKYTFTHDSYSYTAFSDDNIMKSCPDCGGEHMHTPYQAAGTNEKGLTVTATETLRAGSAVSEADPKNYVTGIEESDIPTVLLSECATAKEALDLLTSIYDNYGCQGGSGIFLSDNTETWYIENTTGSAYIAVKLTPDMAFIVPNQSVIGLIDLDDTENVVASANLIEVAKTAGTYVGDEEANTIDYVASYNPEQVANDRMINGLAHLNSASTAEPTFTDYAISNVDAEGNIVPMYTNIELDRTFTVDDIVEYYDIEGIGSASNLEIHIFQVFAEDSITDTVEWVAMDCGLFNVFVPYYPMLTTDTYTAYQAATDTATFTQEEPTEGLYYPTTGRIKNEAGERVTVEGFKVLPTTWKHSYYWAFDALSNLCMYGNYSEDEIAAVEATLATLQDECYSAYADLQTAAAGDDASVACTEISMNMAEKVHTTVVGLVEDLIG